MNYKVNEQASVEDGEKKIEWARSRMPVMSYLKELYQDRKPLAEVKIAGCLHVTKETAVLIDALKSAGANLRWCGCNPLSTQDDVAAALAKFYDISIYAWRGQSREEYYWCIDQVLSLQPNITVDDGADLVFTLHRKYKNLLRDVWGGTEETTTGVHRLRMMEKSNKLKYPIIAVNDAETKWDFDNIYGTGQSTLDGIIRATNELIAGKKVVVAGYGHCGKGIAMRARGLGAEVIVTEVNPIAALRAKMDGYEVMPMSEAAKIGDIFVTATGCRDVITKKHMKRMKDGAILANAGHFNVEVSVRDLDRIAANKREVKSNVTEYTLASGKRLYLLAEGRLVNLVAAEGHPPAVMDMSFANQFLSILYLVENKGKLESKVYNVPKELDEEVARIKLRTMGVKIDSLTAPQRRYLRAYEGGT